MTERNPESTRRHRRSPHTVSPSKGVRRCIDCGEDKPDKEFYPSGQYMQNRCKKCDGLKTKRRLIRKRFMSIGIDEATREIKRTKATWLIKQLVLNEILQESPNLKD